jgi:hypothetical protein
LTAGVEAFAPGYVIYLACIFVPGYGIGELFGRWTKDDGLVQRIGHSLGYGIAIDTVVFVLKTLGFRIGPINLSGAGPSLVYLLIALGVVMLAISFGRRRKFEPVIKPTTTDLAVVLCSTLILLIAWLYFLKFPIFPPFYNPDYIAVVKQPIKLIAGSLVTIPKLTLYGAGAYQTAAAFLAVGSANLMTAQISMAALAALSPLLVYSVSLKLFKKKRIALLTTVIYTLSGTIWVQMIYSDGLYPNFVGVLLELMMAAAFLDLSAKPKTASTWAISGMVLIAGYFSHYTVLALLASLLAFTAFYSVKRDPGARGMLLACSAFLAPAVLGLVFLRQTLLTDLTISYQSGTSQPLTTYLSNALSFAPSLAYLAFDNRNDVGFIAMALLLAAALYFGVKSKEKAIALVSFWFFGLLLASPQNYAAWRFALEAFLPMTLLAAYGLDSLMPKRGISKISRLRAGDPYRFGVVVLAVLFLTPIAVPGWTSAFAGPLVQNTAAVAQIQGQEADAMHWLAQNTPSTYTSLSITDPTFLYTGLLVGRNCSYAYFGNETQAVAYAVKNGNEFLIVTKYNVFYNLFTPVSNGTSTSLPWFTYTSTSGAKLAYNNPDVKIFQINVTS